MIKWEQKQLNQDNVFLTPFSVLISLQVTELGGEDAFLYVSIVEESSRAGRELSQIEIVSSCVVQEGFDEVSDTELLFSVQ